MTSLHRSRATRPPHRPTRICNDDAGREGSTQARVIKIYRMNTLALHGTVQRQGAFLKKHEEQVLEI